MFLKIVFQLKAFQTLEETPATFKTTGWLNAIQPHDDEAQDLRMREQGKPKKQG